MRIGIDCRLAGRTHAGIGRYILELVSRITKQHPEVSWVLFFSSADQITETLGIAPRNCEIILVSSRHYTLFEQFEMTWKVWRAKLDLLHVPHFNVPIFTSTPLVVTIHDLLWHEQRGESVTTLSGWLYWVKYLGYKFVVWCAVSKAIKILVPAETIKQVIASHYPSARKKIVVTPEGVSEHFVTQDSEGKEQTKEISKNLVYVGSLYPHKNVSLVIRALTLLPDYTLSIVGARSVFKEKLVALIAAHKLQKRVQFKGYLPDKDVAKLLSSAHSLVQPSISEGFGLTGVEAMQVGCPVIASDIPIFREVYGSAAQFFNPLEVTDFVQAVKKLETKSRREALINNGLTVAKKYQWGSMVAQTMKVYEQSS